MSIKKIPCGGFYVNDDAVEMIDGKPVLKTSGSDEVLDNAKETGGIGWTESGEQTVITWDGNTEGRESVVGVYYKVSDSAPTIGVALTSFTFAGTEIPISEDYITEFDEHAIFVGDGEDDYIFIAYSDTSFEGTEINKGVYFYNTPKGYVSSLTYGTPDTIHKIDEKYLPASGGAMVTVPIGMNIQTYEYELTDDSISVLDTIKSDFESGKRYPICLLASVDVSGVSMSNEYLISSINAASGQFVMSAYAFGQGASGLVANIFTIMNVGGEWSIGTTNIGE